VIVVDTNVLVYAVQPGEQTAAVLQARRLDPDWIAPVFWRLEMFNVLAVSMRVKQLELETAIEAFAEAEALVEEVELQPSAEESLRLAQRASISAYDAEFVLTAERLDVRLVTADRRLAAACPDRAVFLTDFVTSGSRPRTVEEPSQSSKPDGTTDDQDNR
jgi:predicted nucleic acid-binding protein